MSITITPNKQADSSNFHPKFTASDLRKVGVELLYVPNSGPWLRCSACGHAWGTVHRGSQRQVNGWWKCPNNCNAQ